MDKNIANLEKLTIFYSKDKSRDFWDFINDLPDEIQHQAYTLGVILQNVEADIVRQIRNLLDEIDD